jgi:TetR/AcrR family transcriptional repressor of nem operon
MGRTSDARERLIDAAFRLWFTRSFADVGVNEICEEAGVRKGSFYHFFPSKTDLALAVIDDIWGRYRIERNYQFAVANKADTGHVWGCPIGNLAVELSTQDESVRARLNEFFGQWAGEFAGLLDEAVAVGDLPPHDTRAAGLSLLAYVQGMTVLAKTGNDPDLIRTIGPTIVAVASTPAEVAV